MSDLLNAIVNLEEAANKNLKYNKLESSINQWMFLTKNIDCPKSVIDNLEKAKFLCYTLRKFSLSLEEEIAYTCEIVSAKTDAENFYKKITIRKICLKSV